MDHITCIRTFLRVAEVENFSETARQLGVPKSLVTRRIHHLEKALGTPLLVRTTRRVRLTEAGTLYRQRVVGLLDELDALETSIAAHDLELRGLMRISSPTAFGVQALRRALADFMRNHPELTMELTLNDGPVNPVDEGYDMVITDRGGISGQFQEEPLFRFDLLCCAAPSYLQARGVPQVPADLREHDCIQYLYHESGHEWRFGEGEQMHRVQVQPRLTSNSGALMHDAAVDGEGVAILPFFLARQALDEGRLVEVLPGYSLPQKTMKAVLPRKRETVRRNQQLVEHLRHALGTECPQRGALRGVPAP